MPATGACASVAAPVSHATGNRASSAALPATGASASSAAPLSCGIFQATGVCASSAAPFGLGTGSHASNAAPRATRRAVVRLLACTSLLSARLSCPSPLGHAVAVGLRCGKAATETPRSRFQLDSALPRNSGGRSTLFLVKESTKFSYLVPLSQQVCRELALSGGHLVATRPSPAFESVYWVNQISSFSQLPILLVDQVLDSIKGTGVFPVWPGFFVPSDYRAQGYPSSHGVLHSHGPL